MWTYADSRDAVRDALRLSRAMTYKAAVAGLPQGGGKGVIVRRAGEPPLGPERAPRRAARLRRHRRLLGGRYLTAEDVGTSDADMTVIAEGTRHVSGLAVERGGSGDPSPWTALGVLEAIEVACERVFGTPDLAERSRRGHRASATSAASLARLLAAAGARLVCADVDEGKRPLADELGADWTDPDAALLADVDVLAPCALGGVLDAETVPALRCRAIAGAANNQLADRSVAEVLTARGILWAPDFVVNAGGIVNIAVELEPGGYDPSAPRSECAPSATRCGRSSTRRRPRRPPRSPPLWRSRAAVSLRPAPLGLKLLSVRPQRDRRRRPQRGRRVVPHGVEQLVLAAQAVVERRQQPRSRSRRWARYSSSLPPGPTPAARGRGRSPAGRAGAARCSAVQVPAMSPATNTLPSPSTASPAKQTPSHTNARWSCAWPGSGARASGPKRSPSPSRTSAA